MEGNFTPRIYIESNSSPTLFFLCQAHMGMCFMNKLMLHEVREKRSPSTNLFPLTLAGERVMDPVVVLYPDQKYYPEYFTDFMDIASRVLDEINRSHT